MAALCPGFDAERFGVINTGNPKHADIFLVTGSINEQNKDVVKQIYDQMVEPKVVAACGICACNGGVFKDCYNVSGGVDTVIPVDVYLPGCAVRPESIIDAVVLAIDVLDKKAEQMKNERKEKKNKEPKPEPPKPKPEEGAPKKAPKAKDPKPKPPAPKPEASKYKKEVGND